MRYFILLLLSPIYLLSNNNIVCKKCHPTIYKEFLDSFHHNSTIKKDKVHSAIWNMHPDKKKNNYKCAKCHAPNKSNPSEGVSCITCHTIIDVKKHIKSNKNIYETKPKTLYSAQKGMESKKVVYKEKSSWFGMVKTIEGSPYHDIDYRNKGYYNGNICLGCHSHKQNSGGFTLCKLDAKKSSDKNSCISCHMPKVEGSATTIRFSKKHAYHGFSGVRNNPKMLAKYIDINFTKSADNFTITIDNHAPHKLLTQPLRIVELRVNIIRESKTIALKPIKFARVIGKDGKPSMPWIANEVVKDSMINGYEKRAIEFKESLKSRDRVEVTLGYYIVNPKVAKKINIKDSKLHNFIELKYKNYNVK